MLKNSIWELIAKKLAGEATQQELGDLEDQLRNDPDMHYPMQTVADLWHQQSPDTENVQEAFSRHTERLKTMGIELSPGIQPFTNQAGGKKRHLRFAALGLLLLLAAGYYLRLSSSTATRAIAVTPADKSEISTKYGSRTKLLLPDSTQVWLNSGSKLSYDKTYGNTLREVTLSGEAYFDVVKNAAHPFVIHTGSIDIKVLGTAFNVKSFPGEKNTETSLIRGSIEVTFKNRPAEKIILKPNEKLITANEETVPDSALANAPAEKIKAAPVTPALKQEPMVLVSHLTYIPADSTVVETSWMDNKLVFRSESFEDLAVKMERWYGVTIHFADDAIKPKRLNGVFENESVQQALKALQLITPFTYTLSKNLIVISSKY